MLSWVYAVSHMSYLEPHLLIFLCVRLWMLWNCGCVWWNKASEVLSVSPEAEIKLLVRTSATHAPGQT